MTVGFLVGGTFTCIPCADKFKNQYPEAIPVYDCNILPYSQICLKCERLIVKGIKDERGRPLSLFKQSVLEETLEILWKKCQRAIQEEDWEVLGNTERAAMKLMLEHSLHFEIVRAKWLVQINNTSYRRC